MINLYQLWAHRDGSEVYVVQLGAALVLRVRGVCGPLDPQAVPRGTAWENLTYERGPAIDQLTARRGEFIIHVL